MGPHHLLDPIMGGPCADPGEKQGPRIDVEGFGQTLTDDLILQQNAFPGELALSRG